MINHNDILCSPTYKNLKPCSYAVSSPNGAKRHMVSGPPPRRVFVSHGDSPPLPGLSSMLHYQRYPQDAPIMTSQSWQGNHVTSDVDQSKKFQYHTACSPKIEPMATPDHDVSSPETVISTPKITAPLQKSSRYLREIDRRTILSRIEQGEKQSVLAKEYQVSRAAICNLNKHRDEVLSRKDGNPLAKHPKKPRSKITKTKCCKTSWTHVRENGEPEEPNALYEIKSRAAALLLTTLRKKHATVNEFRRSNDRLMRIVMEEALAHVPVKTVDLSLPNRSKSDGIALEHPPCAVSMEPAGCPMLNLFNALEPDQPTGYVSFGNMSDSCDETQLQPNICGSKLPSSLNYHNVFLMDHVVTSADVVVAVVRRLLEHGAVEAMISLVALIATTEAVEKVHSTFPALKIVVAQVENTGTLVSSKGYVNPDAKQMCVSATDMILDRLEQVYTKNEPVDFS